MIREGKNLKGRALALVLGTVGKGRLERAFDDRSRRSRPTMSTAEIATATHQTAETQFVDADGVRFAYRRFGAPSATPLVMLQHFRGNLDSWDPALTDALAASARSSSSTTRASARRAATSGRRSPTRRAR